VLLQIDLEWDSNIVLGRHCPAAGVNPFLVTLLKGARVLLDGCEHLTISDPRVRLS